MDRNGILTFLFLLLLSTSLVFARQDGETRSYAPSPDHPVVFKKDTLFYLHAGFGPFSPDERMRIIQSRINTLALLDDLETDSLVIVENVENYELRYKGKIIIVATPADAEAMEMSTADVAAYYKEKIGEALQTDLQLDHLWKILMEAGLTILVVVLFYLLIKYVNKLFRLLFTKLVRNREKYLRGIRFRNYEFISAEQELVLVKRVFNLIKWLLIILLVYASLPVLFSIFPETKGIAKTLFGYIWRPFKSIFAGIWGYFPNIISIAIVLFITHYVIRFLKFLSEEVQSEKLLIPGFYPDWATPTFNIFRFLLYAFALVIIFPYLPGSNSPIFQGVSVFLGLLISLGSTSAISNLIAGLVITYMRAFKIGDRVKIGDTVGDVLEKTALVTRLRTIKNETITIPNSSILTGQTVNYSNSADEFNLILHTSVTIGYDVPWRKVHEMLIQAARKTHAIQDDPAPFVLQTSLDDSYVSYQLNVYTAQPKESALIYSELHQNIQDVFNENGVEIMSPQYEAHRDGNAPAMPKKEPS